MSATTTPAAHTGAAALIKDGLARMLAGRKYGGANGLLDQVVAAVDLLPVAATCDILNLTAPHRDVLPARADLCAALHTEIARTNGPVVAGLIVGRYR